MTRLNAIPWDYVIRQVRQNTPRQIQPSSVLSNLRIQFAASGSQSGPRSLTMQATQENHQRQRVHAPQAQVTTHLTLGLNYQDTIVTHTDTPMTDPTDTVTVQATQASPTLHQDPIQWQHTAQMTQSMTPQITPTTQINDQEMTDVNMTIQQSQAVTDPISPTVTTQGHLQINVTADQRRETDVIQNTQQISTSMHPVTVVENAPQQSNNQQSEGHQQMIDINTLIQQDNEVDGQNAPNSQTGPHTTEEQVIGEYEFEFFQAHGQTPAERARMILQKIEMVRSHTQRLLHQDEVGPSNIVKSVRSEMEQEQRQDTVHIAKQGQMSHLEQQLIQQTQA